MGQREGSGLTPWPGSVYPTWGDNATWGDNGSWGDNSSSWSDNSSSSWSDNNSSSSMRSLEQQAEQHTIDHIQVWVTPVLVVVGSAGNIVSVVVFHSRKLRSLSSSCYLAALAASDTVFLATLLVVWVSRVWRDLVNQPGWCQALVYATYVTTFLSVWLVVAFTVERFIAVCYPLLRAAVCTVRRARLVIFLLTAVALMLYSYLLVAAAPGLHPTAGRTICKVRPAYMRLAAIMNHLDTLLTLLLPLLIIVSLNVRIARCVWHVQRLRHSMTLAHSHSGSGGPGGPQQQQQEAAGGQGRGGHRPRVRSQNKVTKMLLVISTVFIVLNLPSYLMRAYILLWCGDSCDESATFYTLQQTFTLLFYTNFAINFLLYCVTGQNFRRAVKTLCFESRRCRRRRPGAAHGRDSIHFPPTAHNPTGDMTQYCVTPVSGDMTQYCVTPVSGDMTQYCVTPVSGDMTQYCVTPVSGDMTQYCVTPVSGDMTQYCVTPVSGNMTQYCVTPVSGDMTQYCVTPVSGDMTQYCVTPVSGDMTQYCVTPVSGDMTQYCVTPVSGDMTQYCVTPVSGDMTQYCVTPVSGDMTQSTVIPVSCLVMEST
ncbi:kappa-type opioid receptor-like [Procambarus clarkii]|uniref:kappa-type opioid receptor-like n=1 Tax=Procambarus clarkii TaxID=6728 RepID=UPI0037434B8A